MWRDDGPGVTLLYALHRVLGKLSGGRAGVVSYLLVAQPLGRPGTARLRPDPACEVARATERDAISQAFPRPATVNQQRWRDGAVCYAARVKGRFAGTIWIQRERYAEDEVRCDFVLAQPAESCWDFDVYVDPDFRLGRTMARMWQHVEDELVKQGVRWSFSRISRFNAASLKSHARLGARAVGSATFLVLGGWQFALMGRSGWRISGPGGRRPTLVLHPPDPGALPPG
jgi:GNAT superfamily N-acetyltransferase